MVGPSRTSRRTRASCMSDEAREDGGMKDADISRRNVGRQFERVRRRCVEGSGNRKKQLRRRQKILTASGPVDDGLSRHGP